ncbi:MAG: hypothetical protein ACNYNY_00785 [Candidatus Oxydemutatoraceae bacterium WSBS_2016_MAG_OTU14]
MVVTDVLGILSAPIVTARTEDRRGTISIEWDSIDNAENYFGADTKEQPTRVSWQALLAAMQTLFRGRIHLTKTPEQEQALHGGRNFGAGTYSTSEETRESVLPRELRAIPLA